jgi:hypothetical protein
MPAAEWTQLIYTFIMLNKFVVLDSGENSSLTNVSAGDVNIAYVDTMCQGQWDVQLAVREADIQRLGGLFVEKIGGRVELTTRLDDGSRPMLQALALLIKEMVDGHKKWLHAVEGRGASESRSQPPHLKQKIDIAPEVQLRLNVEEQPNQVMPPTDTTAIVEAPWESNMLANSLLDIPFAPEASWPEGVGDNFLWDTMMDDMTALPFGLRW